MGLDINLQTSKIDISEEDGINVDLYTDKLDIEESEAEDIIIEITGLKSINKFIGLEDTPLYYENGKFFKVQDNKIIYTDIEWKDITGDIDEGSSLFKIIDSAIKAHDENPASHQYIQDIIQNNYNILDNKIDTVEDELNNNLSIEIQNRIDADTALGLRINGVISDIQLEATTRAENDTLLQNNIDSLSDDLDAEIGARETADLTLTNNLNQEIQDRIDGDNSLDDKIDSVEGALSDSITALDNKYDTITDALDDKIDSVEGALNTHISNKLNPHEVTKTQIGLGNVDNTSDLNKPISTATQNALDGKVPNTRTVNGKALSNNISLDYTDVNALPDTTTINDLTSTSQQNALNSGITSSLVQQISTNQSDISDLTTIVSGNYTTLNNRITNEVGTLNTSISNEETARINADNNLQSQIDAITSASDVTDIVGTYAELQAYDTTSLPDKSIIKVLQDESRNDETTYYRWIITNGTGIWSLIGEEGPYYTKSEADSTFVTQTTTVNNKALSSNITLTASDVGALPDNTIIGNGTLTIQKNGTTIDTFNANTTSNKTINISVPTDTSDLTNNAGFISGITSSDVTNALGYTPENINNKVTSLSSSSTDTQYPSAKLVYDELNDKQDTLIAGTDLEIIPASAPILPEGYTQIEYIEGTGTQYIDIGYYGTQNSGAYIKYALTDLTSNGSARVFGTRNGTLGTGAFAFITSKDGTSLPSDKFYIASNGYTSSSSFTNIDANWHEIHCNIENDKKVYFDGSLVFTGNDTAYTSNAQASIFRTYNQTAYGKVATAKISILQIYENAVMIRNYIPCRRDSDDELGMYELLTDTFLANSGTGTFIAGPDVIFPEADLINFTNESGYIKGIDSTDVITALGYTPYDSTNPAGYTSNIGTVTSVNNIQPVNGNVSIAIPDTSNLANKDLSNLTATGEAHFQVPLVSGTNIKTVNNESLLGSGNIDTSVIPPIAYGTSTTAAATVQKEVSIPSITELKTGQVIVVQPTITSTVANSTIKLNNFDPYPMRYNNADITTSTDSVVWSANYVSQFVFDGTYWQFAGHGLDSNTTYTLNYSVDAGAYKSGTGSYAISRYSLCMQKPDMTWEKVTATNANYSTGTSKNVNTNGFILGNIRYYSTTTNIANGANTATNTMYEKAATLDLRYSTNCGDTPSWTVGDYIYFVGTMGADGLFYLDTTTWWTNTLPSTNDGKLYIQLGKYLSGSSISLYENHPVYYYDGTKLCEYKIADNKQDTISDLSTIRSNATNGQSAYTTIGGYGNIVTHNTSEFATSAQGSLADTALQPNDNISLLNNNAGYITSSALAGYATENFVTSQGYITGITSGDVTTALGYTPYSSANPNGYQANVIETIKVNGTAQTVTSKTVDITVPSAVTESTVSGWGFTKNTGTVTSVNNTQPDANGNVSLTIPTVGNGTITINQGGTQKGTFTLNQSGNTTINLDAGGGTVDQTFDGTSANAQSGVAIETALTDGSLDLVLNESLTVGNANLFYDVNDDILSISGYSSMTIDAPITIAAAVTLSTETDPETGDNILYITDDITSDTVTFSSQGGISVDTSTSGGEFTYNGSEVATLSDIPTNISDLTDDTATNPVDKADTLTGLTATVSELNYTDGVTSNIQTQFDTITGKIPSQASTSNQLADKAFVNSSVQTVTANFRGNWDTWALVPTSASSYPADYTGSTTPTVNDYLVVQDASDYTGDTLEGTWRFKYTGTWSTDGKSGWNPEYQVNETPLTSAQLAALNSGITSGDVTLISTALQPSDITNMVTTDTDQNITGTKTFVGQKRIGFKQSGTSDKLGFTLYNSSNVEKGYLEFNPSNTVDSVPLMTLGNYASSVAGLTHVGFRKYSSISGASGAYNLLAPLISDAKTPFNLTTTYTNFYLPLGFTDGNTTVLTAKSGLVNISSLLPTVPTNISAFTNDSGYITSSALSPYVLASSLATVATSGSYNDLSNKPTIPTVGDGTITINQGGVQKGTFTVNQSGNTTINLDAGGGTVDQTFDGTSANAQSGIAIYGALTDGSISPTFGDSIHISSANLYFDSDNYVLYSFAKTDFPEISINSNYDFKTETNAETGENELLIYSNITSDSIRFSSEGGILYNGSEVATQTWVGNQGYTSNVGTVTSVNNVSPVNGNVTLSIPDTSTLANKDLSNLSATGEAHFQAPISDLATIRSGASAGATAVQPATLNNYVAKSEVWYDSTTSTLYIGVAQS